MYSTTVLEQFHNPHNLQAGIITADDLMRVLGGLPLGKEHAAHLAIQALCDALRQVPTADEALGRNGEGAIT